MKECERDERERESNIRLWSTYRGCKLVVPYKEEETSTNPPLVSFSSRLPAKRVTRFTIHRTRREPPQGEICETSEEIFRCLLSPPVSSCFSFSLFRILRLSARCSVLWSVFAPSSSSGVFEIALNCYFVYLAESSRVVSRRCLSLNFSFRDWFYNLFILASIEKIRAYRVTLSGDSEICALISSIYSQLISRYL